ncbi:MAG TPA: hypothetical protein VNZ55_04455 [Thermomicrobiales bacterium]|nr:hypothetical protein [Thermomicrobiales bacterium]
MDGSFRRGSEQPMLMLTAHAQVSATEVEVIERLEVQLLPPGPPAPQPDTAMHAQLRRLRVRRRHHPPMNALRCYVNPNKR